MLSAGTTDGIGWAVLLLEKDKQEETGEPSLVIGFVRGNDLESIESSYIPLAVIDVWEHAYVRDFGVMGRRQAVQTYLKYLDWDVVQKRFEDGIKSV